MADRYLLESGAPDGYLLEDGSGVFLRERNAGLLADMLADGPNGLWTMGDASGFPQDSSGNAKHMTATFGTPTYGVTGPVAGTTAIAFDGSTEYFTTPDHALFDLGDVFTLEGFVECSASGAMTIISKGAGAYQLRIVTPGDSGTAGALELVRAGTAEIVESTVDVPSTGLHQVAATKNGATVKLVIDGVDVTGTVSNSTFANNSNALAIGSNLGSEFFPGTVGFVAVYPTALPVARLLSHFNEMSVAVDNRDASPTLVGGGVVVTTRVKGALRAGALVGGGVVVSTRVKGALRTGALTGGGVVALVTTGAHAISHVLKGGGVLASTRIKGGITSALATGGGVLTVAAAKIGHTVSAALTGGGVASLAVRKGGATASLSTGAGVATLSDRKGGQSSAVLTGGGVATIAIRHGSTVQIAATGGGVVTVQAAHGAKGQVAITGGGVAIIDYTRSGAADNRNVSAVLTGGGVVSLAIRAGHQGQVSATGGGVASVATKGAHAASITITGGGVFILTYETTGSTPPAAPLALDVHIASMKDGVGPTPFPDYTLADDDEAVLLLLLATW